MKKILILIIIIILGYGVWKYVLPKDGETPYWERNSGNNQNPSPIPQSPSPTPTAGSVPEGDVWMGTLKRSTIPAKGNLMLELRDSDRTVYMQTARDFSNLIGKDVKVTIDGDFSSFSLVNIEEDK